MVSTFSNIQGIAHSNYGATYSVSYSSGGKLHVPVSPSLVGYTQFEHVQGVAADSGSGGVNISKIKILNTLIDRLIDLKQQPMVSKDTEVLSDSQVDALIEDYQNKIQNVVNVSKSNPYVIGGVSTGVQLGSLFSIAA